MRFVKTNKVAQALCLALVSIWLAGCMPGFGAATPEQAVRQAVERSAEPGAAATVQIAGTRALEGGTIVLYSHWSPARAGRPGMQMFGYYLVVADPRAGGWLATSGGGGGSSSPPPASQLIDFGSGTTGDSDRSLSLIYGRTLSSEVAAVEATFSNGQTVRDTAGDGVFVLAVWEKADWCELRVLAADGQVLLTKEPGPIPALKQAAGEHPGTCPPK